MVGVLSLVWPVDLLQVAFEQPAGQRTNRLVGLERGTARPTWPAIGPDGRRVMDHADIAVAGVAALEVGFLAGPGPLGQWRRGVRRRLVRWCRLVARAVADGGRLVAGMRAGIDPVRAHLGGRFPRLIGFHAASSMSCIESPPKPPIHVR